MDNTPDKDSNSITAALSKFEDSPVFNYINTLSPIKPVNSLHSGQSFQLLSYASPESFNTSPVVGCSNKSKAICTTRLSDTSEPQSSLHGNERNGSGASPDFHRPANARPKVVGPVIEVDAADDFSRVDIDAPQTLIEVCCTPTTHGDKLMLKSSIGVKGDGSSSSEVIQASPGTSVFAGEMKDGVRETEIWQQKGAVEGDLVKWICESADHFLSDLPAKEEPASDHYAIGADAAAMAVHHPNANVHHAQKPKSVNDVCSNLPEGIQPKETFQTAAIHATSSYSYEEVNHNCSVGDENRKLSEKTQLIRRRCLVFEMTGSRYRELVSDPSDSSPSYGQPSSAVQADEKPLRCSIPGSGNFSSRLPGIGLHLNALRVSANNDIVVKQDTVPSKRQLSRTPPIKSSSDTITGNVFAESGSRESPEIFQGSPNKKRRSENTGETESCKRCNCKRSKCLKLYCECFAAGLYCVEPCSCQGCFNQPAYEQTVLETRRQIESRNPLAFAPKVIKFSNYQEGELNKTPASARHKNGCNCRKSGCLKKYCECFQGGVGCSLSCRCEGCKNSFGRKDGTEDIILKEREPIGEIAGEENSWHEVPKVEDCMAQQDIQGKPHSRPDRSAFFSGISSECPSPCGKLSLQPCSSIKSDKSNCLSYQPKIGTYLKMIQEDETPGTSNDDGSHGSGVKSVSPNSKRVSPPYRESETSYTFRSSRKLILKSIPSFPVLPPKRDSAGLQE